MLWVVSSMPRRLAYWWRMPPLARAVEPEQTVSRSRTITRPAPSRARWYAVLTPMIPAPTITTSAVSVIPASFYSPPASREGACLRAGEGGYSEHRNPGREAHGALDDQWQNARGQRQSQHAPVVGDP